MTEHSQSRHLIRMEGWRLLMRWKNVFESTSRRQRRRALKASLGALGVMGASAFMGWQLFGISRALGGNVEAAEASVSAGLVCLLLLALAVESFRRRRAWLWSRTREIAVERWLLGLPFSYEEVSFLGLVQCLALMLPWLWLPAAAAAGAPQSPGISNLIGVEGLAVSAIFLGNAVGDSVGRRSGLARAAVSTLWLLLWGFLVWQITAVVANPRGSAGALRLVALLLLSPASITKAMLFVSSAGLAVCLGWWAYHERMCLLAWRASGDREAAEATSPSSARGPTVIVARGPVSTLFIREFRTIWAWIKREPAVLGATCLLCLIPVAMVPSRAAKQMPPLVVAWVAFLPALMIAEASGRSLTIQVRARLRTSLTRPWLGGGISLTVAALCSCVVGTVLLVILAVRWRDTTIAVSTMSVVILTSVVSTVLNRLGYSLSGMLHLPDLLGRILRLGACVLGTFWLAFLMVTSGVGVFVGTSLVVGLVGVFLIGGLESRMEFLSYE